MLKKNIEKIERKEKRSMWNGYYPRVTKDKSKYTRKEKHKKVYC